MESAVNLHARLERRSADALLLSARARRLHRLAGLLGSGFLLAVTSLSMLAVLFIFIFIAKDALPFFATFEKIRVFFGSTHWFPTREPGEFGALAILVGSGLVTAGAVVVAVPLGVAAAVCLSDVLPFGLRQIVKPVIEMLAAIPSVAYGFFALVVLAPLLQRQGGLYLSIALLCLGIPLVLLGAMVGGDMLSDRVHGGRRTTICWLGRLAIGSAGGWLLWRAAAALYGLNISSGTNAMTASLILGIMALPTVVSVSEDALQAVGRDMREGSYAVGATRAETLVKVVIPAASSGIVAAIILGVMRAVGETMVVWMASGNASQIPSPWYNLLQPVRTLTATIAGEMGEADQMSASEHYHALFSLAFVLLVISFGCNIASERIMRRMRRKLAG